MFYIYVIFLWVYMPLALVQVVTSSVLAGPDWEVEIYGRIMKGEQKLAGATVTLLENSIKVDEVTTSGNGNFDFILKPGNDYMLVASKPGFVSKKLSFSTQNVPGDKKQSMATSYPMDISLFEEVEEINTSILEQPVAKFVYVQEQDDFIYDEDYGASIQEDLSKMMRQLEGKRRETEQVAKTYWEVEVYGRIMKGEKRLAGATVTLLENSQPADEIITSGIGDFDFILKPGNDYLLVASKPGYVSKKLSFSTQNVPADKMHGRFPSYPMDIIMFEEPKGVYSSILEQPVAKFAYDEEKDDFVNYKDYDKDIQMSGTEDASSEEMPVTEDKMVNETNLMTSPVVSDLSRAKPKEAEPIEPIEETSNLTAPEINHEKPATGMPALSEAEGKVEYRVQIAAVLKKPPDTYFLNKYGIREQIFYELHNEMNKYSVGSFSDYKAASERANFIRNNNGVEGAFVTAYKNGNRITVREALFSSKNAQ